MDAPTLACDLEALSPSERARHRQLCLALDASVTDVEELRDGFALRYDASARIRSLLQEWIDLERSCCPFLKVTVREGAGEKALWLHLTGPPGTREFLALRLQPYSKGGETTMHADQKADDSANQS